jgi:hypothetical protein
MEGRSAGKSGDKPHHTNFLNSLRGGGGSHRIEMATEIQCTPPERPAVVPSVFVDKEGAQETSEGV